MRDLLGSGYNLERFRERVRVRRFGDGLGQLGFCFQSLAQDPVGRAALQDALTAAVVGRVEAGEQRLKLLWL